jgi:DNA-binding response OmpR family regulator
MQRASSQNILCVDGDLDSQALVKDVLAGYNVGFANNAFEGLRGLHSRVFDGYLLEQCLPDWSGIQLCREIRKRDPQAPVLFCTSAARQKDRLRALKAGASAYFCKPIDQRLLSQLRVLLELAEVKSSGAQVEAQRVLEDEVMRHTADVPKWTRLDTLTGFFAEATCGPMISWARPQSSVRARRQRTHLR